MRKSLTSAPSNFAPDRGPAKHFHGRRGILSTFGEILNYSTENRWGTTFLIQGAPGAGKTALLYECGKLAEGLGWQIARVNPRALWNSDELLHSLGLGNRPGVTEASAEVGAGSLLKAGVKSGLPVRTTLEILRRGDDPLLLELDEAQMLQTTIHPLPPDQFGIATGLLKSIHNGELGKPVILVAAGLGTTVDAFGTLGISRFEKDALVQLGAVGKEAEHAVLHDWLTKDGKATGDTWGWIDAIAQETHGWPQHILSYVGPALDRLYTDNGVMTAEGLNAVLEEGRTGRAVYYKQRARGFSIQQCHSLAKLFANVPRGGSLELEDIMMSLTQDHGVEKARGIFHRALHKGILDERDNCFAVPVPSMHDWLVSNYAHKQIKFPHEAPHILNLDDRSSGIDFDR